MTDLVERADLEKKDKAELHTIVSALGGKATSRTRKSELIDAIIGMSGGVAEPRSEANGSSSGEPADERSASRNGSSGDRPARAKRQPPAETTAPMFGPDGEPLAEWEIALLGDDSSSDQAGDDAAGGSNESGKSEGSDRSEGRNGTDSNRPESKRSDRNDDGTESKRTESKRSDRNEGRSDNKSNNSNNNNDGGRRNNHDDEEEGNGRRRRNRNRNRNRNRDRDDDQPQGEPVPVEGYLDLRDEGYGFLRVKGVLPSRDDVYIPAKLARQHALRKGDHLKGMARPANRSEKNPALQRLDFVNGLDPEAAKKRPRFENLTPLFPDERLKMEQLDDPTNMTSRIIDLLSPIGKGQRGLIVSPPKAGKTTIMKQIARSIEVNNPEVHLVVLLVDERPEEVTDMRRWLIRGDVAASTFDRPSDEHCAVAELTIERSKRMVEEGKDVVIILDGITRLARAYNLAAPATGRIMSGGVDSGALYPPKRVFGAARHLEEGGSLTILATALVDTGSRMDEVIFEEFKGTGNMELRLDRRLAEKRIYPAIDVDSSSTRHEELLFDRKQLNLVWKLRRVLSGLATGEDGNPAAATELLIDRLKSFPSNQDFLNEIAKAPSI